MATTEAPPLHREPPDLEAGSGTLAAKLARIMGRLGRIGYDGRVDGSGGGYSYASADTLSDVLRPALAAEGVVLIPSDTQVIEQRIDEFEKVGRGGEAYTQTRYTVALRVEWTLTDGETTLRMATVGTGVDYAGKAANAAHTFARVNALKSAFHLSTGEDPEAAQSSSPTAGSRRAARPAWDGAMPELVDPAGVSGSLVTNDDGSQVGIRFRAEDTADFEAIKDVVKAMGARWNNEGRVWVLPADRAAAAVTLGRFLALDIAAPLAERFPAKGADDLAGPEPTNGPPFDPDDDDIPPF
jgi:hypothetical protein